MYKDVIQTIIKNLLIQICNNNYKPKNKKICNNKLKNKIVSALVVVIK